MLIYGANGYTGELVAREAVRRGLTPTLAGRDERGRGGARASRSPSPGGPLGSTIPAAVTGASPALAPSSTAPGPFVRTSRPMVDACLAAGIHYLDITGEIAVFESILTRDAEARRAGAVLLPGIGFDVVPTDCLARELQSRLPDATHLDLAFVAEGGGWSRGTLATMIESLPHAGAMRRNGRIVPLPLAAESMEIDLPVGRRTRHEHRLGRCRDRLSHHRHPEHPDLHRSARARRSGCCERLRPLLPLAGLKPVKRLLQLWVRRTVTGPSAAPAPPAREPGSGGWPRNEAAKRDASASRPPRATP